MCLPNVVIDGWLGDRWTYKQHFVRKVPLSAQRLTLTFLRTYIRWSIVLALFDVASCLRNRLVALQGHNSWADLSMNIVHCQWFIFQPHHLYKVFGKTYSILEVLQQICIIRHNFVYIFFCQSPWRLTDREKLEFGQWPVFILTEWDHK